MKLDKKAGKKLLALSLFIFTSFLSNAVSIKGTMKGISNGSKIYLYQYLTTELIKFDSTKIINGEFKFKEKQYTHGIYKLGSSEEKSIMLIISNEDLDINGDLANVTAQIGNSKEKEMICEECRKLGIPDCQMNWEE